MKQTLLLFSFCCFAAAAQAQTVAAKSVHSNASATVAEAVLTNSVVDVQAVDQISAGNVIHRSATATYTAGRAITLQPGFEAKAGAVFAATIAPVAARVTEAQPELTLSAWPNPFVDKTTVKYSLPATGPVKHTLTDARGAVLRHNAPTGAQAPGTYSVDVDGGSLPAGVYLYQLQTGSQTKTIRLLKQ